MNPGGQTPNDGSEFTFNRENSSSHEREMLERGSRKRRRLEIGNRNFLTSASSASGHQVEQQDLSNLVNVAATTVRPQHPDANGGTGMMMGPPPSLGNPGPALGRAGSSFQQQQQQQQQRQQQAVQDIKRMQQQLLSLQSQANFFGGLANTPLANAATSPNTSRGERPTRTTGEVGNAGTAQASDRNAFGVESQQQAISQMFSQQQTQQNFLALQAAQQLFHNTAAAGGYQQTNFMTPQQSMNIQQTGFFPQQHNADAVNLVGGAPSSVLQGNALISPDNFANELSSLQDDKAPPIFVPGAGSPSFGAKKTLDASEKKGDDGRLCGRKPMLLFMNCDDDSLSEYQCLVRKQIEMFEAGPSEVESNAKGRNKPIVLGQVGIRCRHCSQISPKQRTKGAMYYPAKLSGLYQAAQSLATAHLCNHCKHIPPAIRQELLVLKEKKSSAGGGKDYWGDGVRILGVYEDEHGLRFKPLKKVAVGK